jgi:hypothetical protein
MSLRKLCDDACIVISIAFDSVISQFDCRTELHTLLDRLLDRPPRCSFQRVE